MHEKSHEKSATIENDMTQYVIDWLILYKTLALVKFSGLLMYPQYYLMMSYFLFSTWINIIIFHLPLPSLIINLILPFAFFAQSADELKKFSPMILIRTVHSTSYQKGSWEKHGFSFPEIQ